MAQWVRIFFLQWQIIHCNPPFEDPNASNWAFMTYKLYLPLFLLFFFLPPAFVFLHSRHAAEWHWASPCRGALLSHSSAHFHCPPPPPPPDNELLTEYIIWVVVLFVVVLASEKRDELLMMTGKKRKRRIKKKKVFLGLLLSAAAPSRGLHKTQS